MWISASAAGAPATSASDDREAGAGARVGRFGEDGWFMAGPVGGTCASSTRRPALSSGVSRGWRRLSPRLSSCTAVDSEKGRAMFVRNCWYVIAWDHEVPADGLFSRTVLDEAILLFRTAGGEIVGLRDRCCHRLAPLSKGRKEGDCVRCGYHGLLFDATGRCIEIPGADTVPEKARVQRYPIAVKNKWVFVWMGDPAQADTALLPGQLLVRLARLGLRARLPALRDAAAADLRQPARLLAPRYVHENTLGGTTAIAQARGRRSRTCRAASASRARSTTCRRRRTTARCAASSATSTAGSSTTSSCPARC